MRIRTIKPEFFVHDALFEAEKASKLPLRIAFIGLWCAADREGRFAWEPRRLGVQILPYDNVDFSRVLDALTTRGFVFRYEVENSPFGLIPSFSRHQIINNRESNSALPPPSEKDMETLTLSRVGHTWGTRGARDTNGEGHAGQGEGKGREGERKEGKEALDGDDSGKPKSRREKPVDDEFLALIQSKPVYAGINVLHEKQKCEMWCEANSKGFNRQRLTNWLNNCTNRPVAQPSQGSIPFEDEGQRVARIAALPKREPLNRPGIDD